jgi:hypothetical protein
LASRVLNPTYYGNSYMNTLELDFRMKNFRTKSNKVQNAILAAWRTQKGKSRLAILKEVILEGIKLRIQEVDH